MIAGLTHCQKERQLALAWTGKAASGRFVPSCNVEGRYIQVQCEKHSGYCWCVDENGREIPRTQTRGTPDCRNPGKKQKEMKILLFTSNVS